MSKKNVSLKTIAAECGVSIMTASRALRDSYGVSDSIKEKIRKKAIELGYMPNHVVQSMSKDEKPVIAVLIDSFNNLYFSTLINELMKLLYEKNEYDFMFLYSKQFDNDVIKQCILQRIDLIVTHIEPDKETYEMAKMNNIQIVFVGSSKLDYDMDIVSVDNQQGSVLAAKYLRNFHNSDKYVYIGVNYFLSEQRKKLFIDELKNSYEEDCDIKCFNADEEEIETLYSYIADGYRSLFIYNDMLAYQVLDGLDKIAFDIRKAFPDLHLIGFDGLCEYIPGLKQITTIEIDFLEFATVTYDVICNRLENERSENQRIILPVKIHRRIV